MRRVLTVGLGLALALVSAQPRLAAAGRASIPDPPARMQEVLLASGQPEWAPGRVSFRPGSGLSSELMRAGTIRVRQFPLPDGSWIDLELMASDVVHGGTRFFAQSAEGLRERPRPASRFFRGRVAGEPDSLVSLNLIDGRLAGFIRTSEGEYTFGPDSFADDAAPGDGSGAAALVRVRDDSAESEPRGGCDGEVAAQRDDTLALTGPDTYAAGLPTTESGIDGNTLLLAQVAVEGTVEWVSKHGGVAGAEAYTLNLMAQVSAIYESDLKVQLQVPWMLMHAAEPDGYTGDSSSTATMLNEMVSRWNSDSSLQQVFRTAAHVFSTYPSGGAGRAYVNVLCDGVPPSSSSYDLGVSLLSGNGGSWERKLVAHELGHNFSSPHSHCYSPTLDQCYSGESGCYSGAEVASTGTIMSYCGSTVASFHQRVRDEKMRPAAEAAYPACMSVAGMPGSLAAQPGSGLSINRAPQCADQSLQADPGSTSSSLGYTGSTQAAWIKRFTPGCYPFKLTQVRVRMVNTSSVSPGRALRLLVYADASGGGDPAGASLMHSQDVTVQAVGGGAWNQYTLDDPVILTAGDLYLGFYDLTADAATSYLMDYSSAGSGDSWLQANGTSPGGYSSFSNGTWMIRGDGGGVDPGSLTLSWGQPCNAASVPNQDFAIYQGPLGDWSNLSILTCSTGRDTSWLIESLPADTFWLVVPQNSANEGSYGQSSFGERAPAAVACKPQAIASCP